MTVETKSRPAIHQRSRSAPKALSLDDAAPSSVDFIVLARSNHELERILLPFAFSNSAVSSGYAQMVPIGHVHLDRALGQAVRIYKGYLRASIDPKYARDKIRATLLYYNSGPTYKQRCFPRR